MMRLTTEEITQIVNGKTVPSTEKLAAYGAEYDSRLIKGGELFLALKGEAQHGHDFVQSAFVEFS